MRKRNADSQRDDKTQTERPGIRGDRLLDLLRVTQPDMPKHIGKHGSQDEAR